MAPHQPVVYEKRRQCVTYLSCMFLQDELPFLIPPFGYSFLGQNKRYDGRDGGASRREVTTDPRASAADAAGITAAGTAAAGTVRTTTVTEQAAAGGTATGTVEIGRAAAATGTVWADEINVDGNM